MNRYDTESVAMSNLIRRPWWLAVRLRVVAWLGISAGLDPTSSNASPSAPFRRSTVIMECAVRRYKGAVLFGSRISPILHRLAETKHRHVRHRKSEDGAAARSN
jgi:hypothetical protein